jgi:hypothetical protein
MRRLAFLVLAVAMLGSREASAQTTYVSASVFGDIMRSSHVDVAGVGENSGGGEALGFALRIGTPLGTSWGVEAEFAYPTEIDNETGLVPVPLLGSNAGVVTSSITSTPSLSYDFLSFPTRLPSSIHATQRNTSLTTGLWFQQQLSSRFALVYLGGMTFHRTTNEVDITYDRIFPALPSIPGIPSLPSISLVIPPLHTEAVTYSVRPMAGIESRIEMTEHVQLVPGLRLHPTDNAWLIRPSIGLSWAF